MSAAAAYVFCEPSVHEHMRLHPEDLRDLRPWPQLGADVGECPGCLTTVHVPWSAERRAAEGVPQRIERDE